MATERKAAAPPKPFATDAAGGARTKPAVFVLSDVRLYREGLSWSLIREGSLAVAGAAPPSPATFACLKALAPEAVILDITMAESLQLARSLRVELPRTKLVAFAVGSVDCELVAGAMAGISGYVHRDGSVEDLVSEVLNAVRGELHCSPRHAALLLEQVAALSGGRAVTPAADARQSLTRREAEVFAYVAKGLSNKEIARALNISSATVKNHVHHVLEKLQATRRTQALARIREQRREASVSAGEFEAF
jgi:two-component system, NarL family, nitrate/nitrite response regulator NarL